MFFSFITSLLLFSALALTTPVHLDTTASDLSHIVNSTADCISRIRDSTNANFDWSSSNPVALALSQECLQSHIPSADACVFYTSHSRNNAIIFAAQQQKQTIYDVYPAHWFNTSVFPASKWVENGALRGVFRVTSRSYAISCSGTATVVIPSGEVPCRKSIWVTDELDVIRNHLSKITEVYRASLIVKIGGYWNWVISKLTIDDDKERADSGGGDNQDAESGIELRRRKRGLQEVLEMSSLFESEARAAIEARLEMLKEYGTLIEEWAVSERNYCSREAATGVSAR